MVWSGVLDTVELGARFFFLVNLFYCTIINEKVKIKYGKFSAVLGRDAVTKCCGCDVDGLYFSGENACCSRCDRARCAGE